MAIGRSSATSTDPAGPTLSRGQVAVVKAVVKLARTINPPICREVLPDALLNEWYLAIQNGISVVSTVESAVESMVVPPVVPAAASLLVPLLLEASAVLAAPASPLPPPPA